MPSGGYGKIQCLFRHGSIGSSNGNRFRTCKTLHAQVIQVAVHRQG